MYTKIAVLRLADRSVSPAGEGFSLGTWDAARPLDAHDPPDVEGLIYVLLT